MTRGKKRVTYCCVVAYAAWSCDGVDAGGGEFCAAAVATVPAITATTADTAHRRPLDRNTPVDSFIVRPFLSRRDQVYVVPSLVPSCSLGSTSRGLRGRGR